MGINVYRAIRELDGTDPSGKGTVEIFTKLAQQNIELSCHWALKQNIDGRPVDDTVAFEACWGPVASVVATVAVSSGACYRVITGGEPQHDGFDPREEHDSNVRMRIKLLMEFIEVAKTGHGSMVMQRLRAAARQELTPDELRQVWTATSPPLRPAPSNDNEKRHSRPVRTLLGDDAGNFSSCSGIPGANGMRG